MRGFIFVVLCLLVHPRSTSAEVTSVTVTSRTPVAGGQSFGTSGPYERLVGRIEFALDPADPHNAGIVDLDHAPRDCRRPRALLLRSLCASPDRSVEGQRRPAVRGRQPRPSMRCWDGSIGPRQATIRPPTPTSATAC